MLILSWFSLLLRIQWAHVTCPHPHEWSIKVTCAEWSSWHVYVKIVLRLLPTRVRVCENRDVLFCYPISFFLLWCPWQWHAWHYISIIHMHILLVASTCCSIMMLLHCATSNYPLSPLLILTWDTYHGRWHVSVVHQETGGVSAVAVDHKTRCISGGQPGHPGLLEID
jgi:hypothetical protein